MKFTVKRYLEKLIPPPTNLIRKILMPFKLHPKVFACQQILISISNTLIATTMVTNQHHFTKLHDYDIINIFSRKQKEISVYNPNSFPRLIFPDSQIFFYVCCNKVIGFCKES